MAYQKDISAVLGLSVSTVSRALRGYSDISEETKENVKRVAEELDYKSGIYGKRASPRLRGAVGVVVPGAAELARSPYYRALLFGMAAQAADCHRDFVIMGEDAAEEEMSWIARAASRRAEGVCLLVNKEDLYKGRFGELLDSDIPLVSVENDVIGHTSVCRDIKEDASLLLEYLKEKGHRITAFWGDQSLDSRKCAAILEEAAKRLDMSCLRADSEMLRADAADQMKYTCVIFPSCKEARERIAQWEAQGRRIPETLSAAALDMEIDTPCADMVTCVRNSPEEMGREAVRRLIQILEHPESDIGERVAVKGHIVEGGTVRENGGNSALNF